MPQQKDVYETRWCPGWWPWQWFDTCTELKHKWCYQFSWVQETIYGAYASLKGCENGKLYSWGHVALGVGTTTYARIEECFDSLLSEDGRCDSNDIGSQAYQLKPSMPYILGSGQHTEYLEGEVVESGTLASTTGDLCQPDAWKWDRLLVKQKIAIAVKTRFANVSWFVNGTPISNQSGTLSVSTSCNYPFPLPKGHALNQTVQVSYEVFEGEQQGALHLVNNPADGCYTLAVNAVGRDKDTGEKFGEVSYYAYFTGEVCLFDSEQEKARQACLKRFKDYSESHAIYKKPKPGDPVMTLSEELWRYVAAGRIESVKYLAAIVIDTYGNNPEVHTQAVSQLETELGLQPGGLQRFIVLSSVPTPNRTAADKKASVKQALAIAGGTLLTAAIVYGLTPRLKARNS